MNPGKVYLTGAGPGDPGLITVKGLESIRQADVIVYDRLASPQLLDHAAPHATVIYAGKAPGNHTMKQDEINALLAEKALKGNTVTRLKGGDPFVFGRGGEEALYLQERGIPFEIVPGITSAIAVPAYAGIPVTHRHVASSFMVVTGHECSSKPESAVNWNRVAAVDTVVILMGNSHLSSIAEQLMACGKPAETPIALIRQGTCECQETWVGTLQDVTAKQRGAELEMESPVTIVIGEVVKLREKLNWFGRESTFNQDSALDCEAASVFAGFTR